MIVVHDVEPTRPEATPLAGPLVNPNALHRDIRRRDPKGCEIVAAPPHVNVPAAQGGA